MKTKNKLNPLVIKFIYQQMTLEWCFIYLFYSAFRVFRALHQRVDVHSTTSSNTKIYNLQGPMLSAPYTQTKGSQISPHTSHVKSFKISTIMKIHVDKVYFILSNTLTMILILPWK